MAAAGKTLIALCGAPGSGKSEVQAILHRRFDFLPIDDGMPLRDFAMRFCGARLLDVNTQAGKAAEFAFPGGARMTMREFLGKFGNAIEAILGPDAIPEMAIRQTSWASNAKHTRFSFGSVRRQQGRVYKAAGGFVVEIVRDGYEPQHDFDKYDRSYVDMTITNNGTIEDLETAVRALDPLFA